MAVECIAKKYPATAHVPGGGPPGKMCIECAAFRRKGKTINGECRKATEFRNGKFATHDVPPSTPACKYFEQGALI